MRKMKDSGLYQFGEIPSHWDIISVKDKYSIITGFTPDTKQVDFYDDTDGEVWINISDIGKEKYINDSSRKLSRAGIESSRGNIIPKGSLLYSFKLSVGQVAFAQRDLYTNEAIASFTYNTDINLDYFYYMSGYAIIFNANENIYGAKLLNQKLINNAKVLFPPLPEQQKIADYLDKKVGLIDDIIAKTKESIEEYKKYKQALITETVTKGLDPNAKMKDSGIEWIGEIPEGWEVVKIKHELVSKSIKNYGEEEVLSLYRDYGIIPKKSRDDNHNVTSLNRDAYKFVEIGNLVINKMKAWQGSLAVSNYKGIVSPSYHVCSFIKDRIHKKYFHYLVRNQLYFPEYRRLSTGMRIGQWDLGIDDFRNLPCLIPDYEEQIEIVKYIEKKSQYIEGIINNKQKLITELETYKKSLIYEVVTGKREIE